MSRRNRCQSIGRFPIAVLVSCLLLAAASAARGQDSLELDRFGGLKSLSFGPGDFFRTFHDGQRWWLVTPDGGAFLSLGVCNVNPVGDTGRRTGLQPYRENVIKKHGTVERWTAATGDRLREWGLNTLGNWSSEELRGDFPYTVELGLGSGLWGRDRVPDFFSPETREYIRSRASNVDAYRNDPNLIGYYLDNELPWASDWRRFPDLFPGYVAMRPEAPGKRRLVEFFKERYQTPARFSAVWKEKICDWNSLAALTELHPLNDAKAKADKEAFVLLAAREYFRVAAEAIRARDTDHLILGCRLVWALAPGPVVQACGEYCDVVTINYYEAGPVGMALLWLTDGWSMRLSRDLSFQAFYETAGKPLMITEFGFRGMDSGMPNTYPPGWLMQPNVATQKDRADKFEQCVTTWMSETYFVGYHWFEYIDQPRDGRPDGEDGNYGLVKINDDPYVELVDRFKSVNRRVWRLHAQSGN